MVRQKQTDTEPATVKPVRRICAVDLFCGAGGLTRGLLDAKIEVVAGYDIDSACEYAYSHNNKPSVFKCKSVADILPDEILALYPENSIKVLVGCAPCQPFSTYSQRPDIIPDDKWTMLDHFGYLIEKTLPDVVSMENVPGLKRNEVYLRFCETLRSNGFSFKMHEVFCPDYGIPQQRTRLVLLASRHGEIDLIPATHSPEQYRTVRQTISKLEPLTPGQISRVDPLHRVATVSDKNLKRLRHSVPGGTWRDWPVDLVAECHLKKGGETYAGVYGRMTWDAPSPTITTQFFGFGNGRFGHPEQDRALSLREGALLQTFPKRYQFAQDSSSISFKQIGRLIGNAVPVKLGLIVGKSIQEHVKSNAVHF